jgi:hypothetical protein
VKTDQKTKKTFWLLAFGVFFVLVGASYFPVFEGKIPFPKQLVLQFPPWLNFPRSDWQSTAEIGDLVTSFYPFRAFLSRSVRAGTLPLWNPYMLSGAPFMANAQSALFYPPNLLFYIFRLNTAWSLAMMVRMFLAATFMTLLVRSIGGSQTGSILAGILFAGSGFMVAWQGQSLGDAAIWLPLACFAVQRLSVSQAQWPVAVGAIAFAMPMLAGHPETTAHIALAGTLMAVILRVSPLKFALTGLLALGLASIQMIPTLEWIHELGDPLTGAWPALPLYDALGLFSRDVLRHPNSAGIPIPEAAAYVGMITVPAAALAFFHKSKRYTVFFAVSAILGFCVAYSVDPVHWVVDHILILKAIKNGRLILMVTFGLAAMAGLGVSALEQEEFQTRIRRRRALLALAAAFVVSFLLVYALRRETQFRVEFLHRPSFSRALLFLAVIPLAWRICGGLRGRAFPVAVCSLAAFDLVSFGYGYTAYARKGEVFPNAPAFDFLLHRSDLRVSRAIQLGYACPPNATMMYGIATADGYDGTISRLRDFTSLLVQPRLDLIGFAEAGVLGQKDRRLDLLNVKYVIHTPFAPGYRLIAGDQRFAPLYNDGGIAVFENKAALPRAFAVPVSGAEVIPDAGNQVRRVSDSSFDPVHHVVVGATPAQTAGVTGAAEEADTVDIINTGINDLSLRARNSQPSILVLSQTYYPGWKAYLDGNSTDVFPVDAALTGIAMPAGKHDIQFRFQPASFRIGVAISLVSLLIAAALIWRGMVRRGPRDETDGQKHRGPQLQEHTVQ